MVFSEEFYDAVTELDDYLESQNQSFDEAHILESSDPLNRCQRTDFSQRPNSEIDLGVSESENIRDLDYGFFRNGRVSLAFENYNFNLVPQEDMPAEDDFYRVEGVDNMNLMVPRERLYNNITEGEVDALTCSSNL